LYVTKLSRELGRQIALLIDRRGRISHVIAGDDTQIVIPDIGQRRQDGTARGRRLSGVRCIHTHLKHEPLTQDDINDLLLLRLDLMVSVDVAADGSPGRVMLGHIAPGLEEPCKILGPLPLAEMQEQFESLIPDIESELDRLSSSITVGGMPAAMLIHVSDKPGMLVDSSLDELAQLARTAGIEVADRVVQRRKPDPGFLLGKGKMREFMIRALSHAIDLVIFDTELSGGQLKAVTDFTDIEVMDRTQLILGIFDKHASSRDGKLRVKLAQMRYLLPRLGAKESALSRIRGGIGLRGPGETTAETQRRHLKGRIARLETELEELKTKRAEKRKLRIRRELKTVSIVGYTNAGKSTLLNRLSGSDVRVEDLLFSTLDPITRKVRLPSGPATPKQTEREGGQFTVISDTVGLIRDMPPSLMGVFRATMEELAESDLILLLVDISDPDFDEHLGVAEAVLREVGLQFVERLIVFNKIELADPETVEAVCRRRSAIGISAKTGRGIVELLGAIAGRLFKNGGHTSEPGS
jgi:GTP-binding protein HflX